MIPFAKPMLGEEEAAAAREAILSGWVTQGPKVQAFEESFAAYVGAKHACAVSSGTAALHLALLAVGAGRGDVVITVSHSFISTANAVRHCGAEPVFVDIERAAFNMAPSALERLLKEECEEREGMLYHRNSERYPNSRRVVAIMPVHQLGMPCDIRKIVAIARSYRLPVVEDAACALGSEVRSPDGRGWERIGRPHGDVACFSFHPRKVITTGEGGMLTTNDPELDARIRLLRQQGMSVSDAARHGSPKVIIETYPVTGFNCRMTDIQAAVGIEQLKRLPGMVASRRELAGLYRKHLDGIQWLVLPGEPGFARTNWQSFPVRLKNAPLDRNGLMQYLLDRGVATRPGVMNAHEEQPYAGAAFALRESEKARREVVLLPFFPEMKEEDVKTVAALLSEAGR